MSYKQNKKDINNHNNHNNNIESFLALDDSATSLYVKPNEVNKPVSILYQIPNPANQLTDTQQDSIDSDVLRSVRNLKNFSMVDELDYYQMYNILKQLKNTKYEFKYDPSTITKKSNINMATDNDTLTVLNSGAINNVDLDLFSRLKLELVSSLNNTIIVNKYYVPYHPYQFFKVINSNMISYNDGSSNTNPTSTGSSTPTLPPNTINYVFTVTYAREYKYQQFVFYYDINLTSRDNNYIVTVNKIELIGIPIPKTIEFHTNQKTSDKEATDDKQYDILSLINENVKQGKIGSDLFGSSDSSDSSGSNYVSVDSSPDTYYIDQVSDSAAYDVLPSGDKSVRSQSPNVKFINKMETSDMDPSMFDQNSIDSKIEDKRMNIARDQQFNNHKCFGLIDGITQELPQYKNPIFCKSFHPEINQNGLWDAPCQVNSDCPFYKANKNYPNEFGKCDKPTGKCEMPMGIISLGYTKYGKMEPNCYNCGANSPDSKCCGTQAESIKQGLATFTSPDYVFKGDESYRKQFTDDLKAVGLLVNPSI